MQFRIGFLALALTAVSTSAALADRGADFFKGKTVSYIAATAPGGGYDYYARLVAGEMEKHLPGSTFVVRNMPGAGHLIGANYIANAKPDGLTIGIFNTGLIYNQLIKLKGVRFDLATMSWIGKAASDPRVIAVGKLSPIKSFEDLQKSDKPVKFAIGGIGSAAYVETVMLKNAFNLPVRIITGYNGGADMLAMRRGEVDASVGSLSTLQDFAKNGHGTLIVQIGGSDKAAPQLATFAKDQRTRQLISLVKSQGELSRFTVGPAGIPADRLEALRMAYRKTMESEDVKQKVQKAGRPLDPAYGEDVAKAIKEALDQSPETIALLKEAMDAGKNVKLPTFSGSITGLADRNKDITMSLEGGKEFKTTISGSRTVIEVGGKKVKRDALKIGQACTITAPRSGAEAQKIDCN
ncbi:MAG: hypothetical protein RLZ98_1348 [Pseudomonadota bacterium]|jgi:tripartite-type tricarboxylate transporter receptor subunit TctC